MTRRILLACGILATLYYVFMHVVVPLQWDGYSPLAQTVSELSAIGAPTRGLWVVLGYPYILLVLAFGFGVWRAAGGLRLRVAGAAIIASGLLDIVWPPMHLRGEAFSLTDALHIGWSAVVVLLMVVAIVSAALAFGRRFRVFSWSTLVIMLTFGALTGMNGPRIAANQPTPWVGLWERISIAAYFVWLVALAIGLLRREPGSLRTGLGGRWRRSRENAPLAQHGV